MSRDLRPVIHPIALSVPDAAAAVGYSESEIKRAVDRGELVRRYANRKPVILADDLLEWVKSLPTEPPARS